MRLLPSPPGDTLREMLEERGLSQTQFAIDTGYTLKHINRIVMGVAPITVETALRLEAAFGGPSAEFWLTREMHYRLALAREIWT